MRYILNEFVGNYYYEYVVLRHVPEKNGIYSNDKNSRSMHRNQKFFRECKEYLSGFYLNILSMDLDLSSQRYRGLSLSSEKNFCIPSRKIH